MSVTVATLGFPRIGPRRELKTELEQHWAGRSDAASLLAAAARLRAGNWAWQRDRGADVIPSNDFSLYDHVLDTSAMVGAIPPVYGWAGGPIDSATYFAMARGTQGEAACAHGHAAHAAGGVPAAEMTKWFDTNYHYLVPEFSADQVFRLSSTKPVDEYNEARAQGIETRPVLLGPVSYLLLGKARGGDFDPLTLLPRLLPVYVAVLRALADAGAGWVQIDEPCLVLDLNDAARAAYAQAYAQLHAALDGTRLMLTTYFGDLGDNLATALALPVDGLHIDLVRAPGQLQPVLDGARPDLVLSLGVIDGRNVWRADLHAILERIAPAVRSGRTLQLAPSCSLLHSPLDLDRETALDEDVRSWLAFAVQKIGELAILARALNTGVESVRGELDAASAAVASRRTSPRINSPAVQARVAGGSGQAGRATPFPVRQAAQRAMLDLPPFPTTTIGSFPQTPEVRQARAAQARGALAGDAYEAFLKEEIAAAVRWQEEMGLDVLVHGEFERNDMVQYFGEHLSGFVFTRHGWVQSYGSRCVRPPIIYGDVARPEPMTVGWWDYAQSLTARPMKGMLTGPVTILNWSFVRDDQPRETTCRQIAYAIRDEVVDLERAGAAIIQIDEAALREGLPLRRRDWQAYLDWAVASFRIASSGVADVTQIHTHMCYSEFNDIIAAIAAMDADVISIETARSKMELLDAFVGHRYPAEIGPGVYDIHSPREPSVDEMVALLKAAARRLDARQIWVNPDCGLKTRKWPEVWPAIASMVAAARAMRAG
ncbi:5-methyltetrahydropteroyltriglutamate--homocysteine S-methyltransferase [Gluconacetobacter tumulicola]|uniref:5-methyltetrahydropteroyltriglutamate--homocysteine methyltransferase n=1 Tax=Gluconacetobacter tumulicola TaxID=1017177 RepID=A0A7W4JAL8_9PROT|nr:5-methyltetrahydropteroyltriglutamate--homocysteine S-methyltransferase [Gluconacetobacter tumulicola]MBB2177759.1 5-methyltetrahydropteroyltriglutamate--homocysteine S-methyltransferase [Gluconacetobacter tumulicola]